MSFMSVGRLGGVRPATAQRKASSLVEDLS